MQVSIFNLPIIKIFITFCILFIKFWIDLFAVEIIFVEIAIWLIKNIDWTLKPLHAFLFFIFDFLDFIGMQIGHLIWNNIVDSFYFVLGIEHNPSLQVIHSLDFVQNVCAWDTQTEKAIKISRAVFETISEARDWHLVLIVLLQDTSQDSPCFTILHIFL